jgi:TonB-linked SusC/RagA family outer membrane protein
MRKRLTLLAAFLCVSGILLAQKTVTGKVTDDKGTPLPNVSITVKDSRTGTTSKENGTYSLAVPPTARVLIFASIGMASKEIQIGNKTSIDVALASASAELDEVVVLAYGSVKKSNFTGSAAQISSKDLEKRTLSNPLNAIVGAGPGIQTTTASGAPGSSPGIVIRGLGSISLSSGPLYVVDGAVYDAGFSNFNPDDIESITILKDASTTALYGSRGANGVVVITSKKGKKGRQSLQFKTQVGFSTPGMPEYPTVGTNEFYPLAWESYRNGLVYGTTRTTVDSANMIASGKLPRYTTGANAGLQQFRGTGAFRDIYQYLGYYNPYNVGNTDIVGLDGKLNPNATLLYGDDLDWRDQATRTGQRQQHSLSYSAATDKSDLTASFSYLKEGGWGPRSDMTRFTGRVNANINPTKWFRTGLNLAGNRSTFNNASTGGIVNSFYFARYVAPIYPVHLHTPGTGAVVLDPLGNPRFDYGNEAGYARPYNSGRHSLAEHLLNKDNEVRDVLSTRAYADVMFTNWLKLTTNISMDVTNSDGESYENPLVGDGYPAGRYSRSAGKTTSYTFNQLLNFNKRFGGHNFDALVGHENYNYNSTGTSGMRTGEGFSGVYIYNNFVTIASLASSAAAARTEAFLSRVQYDYNDKYLVSASLRRDASSKFPDSIRWENFWSVGVGWRIDKEDFFKVPFVDMLKLRASYGYTGNANGLGNYPYQAGYSTGYNDDTRSGVILTSLSSGNLTWETQRPLDIGLDFSLFQSRLSGTIGYFYRASTGLIFDVPQPLQNGGTPSNNFSISQNIGSMDNKGFEVSLTGGIFRGKNFNWNMTVNATTYKNKITKMPPLTPSLPSGNFRREVGHSIYDYYFRTFYGVDPADGQALYLGAITYDPANSRLVDNGKGGKDTVTIDHNNARQTFVGESALPDVYGSVVNSFSYKNFDLSVTLTYQLGGKVYDGVYASLMSTSIGGNTYHKDIFKRWQKPGDITNVPRLDETRSTQFGAASTRWLTDASYLAINNVNLSYRVPASLASKIGASNITVYVSGENLQFFSKRKGMNVNGNFNGSTGDSYDVARVLNLGLSVNF